jgi:hypothetical protein
VLVESIAAATSFFCTSVRIVGGSDRSYEDYCILSSGRATTQAGVIITTLIGIAGALIGGFRASALLDARLLDGSST